MRELALAWEKVSAGALVRGSELVRESAGAWPLVRAWEKVSAGAWVRGSESARLETGVDPLEQARDLA